MTDPKTHAEIKPGLTFFSGAGGVTLFEKMKGLLSEVAIVSFPM